MKLKSTLVAIFLLANTTFCMAGDTVELNVDHSMFKYTSKTQIEITKNVQKCIAVQLKLYTTQLEKEKIDQMVSEMISVMGLSAEDTRTYLKPEFTIKPSETRRYYPNEMFECKSPFWTQIGNSTFKQ